MTSREAFEAHIKSLIETDAGEAQALARDADDDYVTAWVRHQWWGFQTGIQHARDAAAKACDPDLHADARHIADAIKEALK